MSKVMISLKQSVGAASLKENRDLMLYCHLLHSISLG